MTLNLILLVFGFILLGVGSETLVNGAAGISKRLNISPIIVGVFILAIGTSLPELVVSIRATLHGAEGLVLGNVVGSNITNVLLVFGVAVGAGFYTKKIQVDRREKIALIGASLFLLGFGVLGKISLIEGSIMLLVLIGYFFFLLRDKEAIPSFENSRNYPLWLLVIFLIFGLVMVLGGAELVVTHARNIALHLGISDIVIGLTIVALGTSLPELVISFVAARKGAMSLAIGNVLGSNIINILGILGISALISPIPVQQHVLIDVVLQLLISLTLVFLLSVHWQWRRVHGVIMVAGYIAYIIFSYRGV
ncbi:MAG: calcium/sodium antiporter [Parvibaculales bacterium]